MEVMHNFEMVPVGNLKAPKLTTVRIKKRKNKSVPRNSRDLPFNEPIIHIRFKSISRTRNPHSSRKISSSGQRNLFSLTTKTQKKSSKGGEDTKTSLKVKGTTRQILDNTLLQKNAKSVEKGSPKAMKRRTRLMSIINNNIKKEQLILRKKYVIEHPVVKLLEKNIKRIRANEIFINDKGFDEFKSFNAIEPPSSAKTRLTIINEIEHLAIKQRMDLKRKIARSFFN